MPFNRNHHHRRSIRLKDYDYTQPGGYFVTICVKGDLCVFGNVEEEEVRLTKAGEIARKCWEDIPKHYPQVDLDAFVIMPNHVHGIIGIIADVDDVRRGLINQTPTTSPNNPDRWILMKNKGQDLGKIVRSYKARACREIRRADCDFMWQRNYYEHIIRSTPDLHRIRNYITENPLRWHYDALNPLNLNTTAGPFWP